jgi:hypothetical protein
MDGWHNDELPVDDSVVSLKRTKHKMFSNSPNRQLLFSGFFLMVFFWGGLQLKSQDIPGVEEKGIVYRNIKSFGAFLHSRGTGLSYRRGKMETGFRSAMFDFSLLTMRHPKEIRSVNPFSDNAGGYVYGKLNSILILRTGYGKHFILHPQGDKGGIETGFSLFGGFSWGLIKPVYLTVFYFDDQFGVREKTERYDPEKHFPDNISGRAPFTKGFSESSLTAGLYGTISMNFEFGKQQKNLRMIETGIAADAFARPVPMMAFNAKNQIFVTLFIRVMYGKLWNRND